MLEFGAVVGVISGLALGVTKVVDFFRNVADKEDSWPKWVWNVIAFVIGIAFAAGWHHNITEQIADLVPALADFSVEGIWGEVMTGIVIGGAAGFWHEFLSALSSVQNKNDAVAGVRGGITKTL